MPYQTLKDISNGPDWVLYAVVAVLGLMSVLLLLGKGGWLIAGYNTASKKEKAKYDETKLCKVVGGGLSVITLVILFMALFESVLPAPVSGVFIFIIVMDILLICFLANTICRIPDNNSDQQEENL